MQPDDRSFSASLPALFGPSAPGIQAVARKIPAEEPRLRDRRRPSPLLRPANETDHAQAGSVLAIRDRAAIAQGGKEAALRVEHRTVLRRRSRHRRMAAAACRLPESHRRVGRKIKRNPTPSTITRSAWSIQSLLDLVPTGPQSDKILADYVDFISNSSLYQQSPAEWFVEPHTLLDRSQTNPAQHAKVLEAYQDSGNPVLALEVALEKTFSGNCQLGGKRQVTASGVPPILQAGEKADRSLYPNSPWIPSSPRKTSSAFEYFLYAAICAETGLAALIYKVIFRSAELVRLPRLLRDLLLRVPGLGHRAAQHAASRSQFRSRALADATRNATRPPRAAATGKTRRPRARPYWRTIGDCGGGLRYGCSDV